MTSSQPNATADHTRLRDLEDDSFIAAVLAASPKRRTFNPQRVLALTFLLLIALGTILLASPLSQPSGQWVWALPGGGFGWRQLVDTLFMATSSACVTGLTLSDPISTYTPFGQAVILACIQIGGIGIMTLGTFLMTLLLGRLSASGESHVMLSTGVGASGKARQLLLKTIRYVFGIELVGALLLFTRYHWHYGYDLAQSCWYAAFHAISAFCNAGITLHHGNLIGFQNDGFYLLTVAVLVTLGGLGFLVIANLSQYRFWHRDLMRRGRISLHSRLVLWATLGLVVIGGLLFTVFEWEGALRPPVEPPSVVESLRAAEWGEATRTLGNYAHRVCEGFSQVAMGRTAGFNCVDMNVTSQPTNFVSILLMLIGGSPGSMAGGLKTTTVILLFLTIGAMIRGNDEVEVHRRTIPAQVCREATVLVFLYIFALFTFYFALLLTEKPLLAERGELTLFYEITSAFGTVGSSLNATHLLTPVGRLLICLAMFCGRLGPISVALIVARRESSRRIRYPEESVTVG